MCLCCVTLHVPVCIFVCMLAKVCVFVFCGSCFLAVCVLLFCQQHLKNKINKCKVIFYNTSIIS